MAIIPYTFLRYVVKFLGHHKSSISMISFSTITSSLNLIGTSRVFLTKCVAHVIRMAKGIMHYLKWYQFWSRSLHLMHQNYPKDISQFPTGAGIGATQTGLKSVVKFQQGNDHSCNYCRWGKIGWAKYLWFQHHQSFHGNIFALPWP